MKIILTIVGLIVSGSAFAATDDLASVIATLTQRPGVHVVLTLRPEIIKTGIDDFAKSSKAQKGIDGQRLSSDNPAQIAKIANYLGRGTNACAAQTLRSLANLFKAHGEAIDAMVQQIYNSSPNDPQKPSLATFQTIRMAPEFYIDNSSDAFDLFVFGCQPGTRHSTGPSTSTCDPVSDDFDYSTIAYKYPIRNLDLTVQDWLPTLDGTYHSHQPFIRASNLEYTGLSIPQGLNWEFWGGNYSTDLMRSDFYESLTQAGDVKSPTDLESKCEVGPGLLALMYGKSAQDVAQGFRLPR